MSDFEETAGERDQERMVMEGWTLNLILADAVGRFRRLEDALHDLVVIRVWREADPRIRVATMLHVAWESRSHDIYPNYLPDGVDDPGWEMAQALHEYAINTQRFEAFHSAWFSTSTMPGPAEELANSLCSDQAESGLDLSLRTTLLLYAAFQGKPRKKPRKWIFSRKRRKAARSSDQIVMPPAQHGSRRPTGSHKIRMNESDKTVRSEDHQSVGMTLHGLTLNLALADAVGRHPQLEDALYDPEVTQAWSSAEPQIRAALLLGLTWDSRECGIYPNYLPDGVDDPAWPMVELLHRYACDFRGTFEEFHGPGLGFSATPLPGPAGELAYSLCRGQKKSDLDLSLRITLILLAAYRKKPRA
ncbi:hypothetical protein [Streptomyces sp. NPDC101166]|uniref:hypothetical protein n=1 Tax=Streptomyces sp. NPDC101166 TaxID=3366120 RepID=UPI00380E873C